ncbi:MAG TPA: methyltransferase domain-containing protein [Chthoniobacterales bacterium]|nr:methyltransferase domain-containing protein [Chthoniobacterales bacterium]
MIFFTICSRNFFAYTQVLQESISAYHANAPFYAFLCDQAGDFDVATFNFSVIELAELGVPALHTMKEKYNIVELNTSIKPFAFLYLFDLHPGEAVIYLDPDILVVSRFEELIESFDRGAHCILTPHLTEPAEFAPVNEQIFLLYGIYNLGFCALKDTSYVQRIVAWWGRRMEDKCIIDLERGLFVDQKWADLLPAFIDRTEVLRHPGYNVAYWNLSQRRVLKGAEGWRVNGQPLRFFHFSGSNMDDEERFTRDWPQINVHNTFDAADLLRGYRAALLARGHAYFQTIPYAYRWGGVRNINEHTPEPLMNSSKNENKIPYLPLLRSHSREDFQAARELNHSTIEKRQQVEVESIVSNQPFKLPGYCSLCRAPSYFEVGQMYSSKTLPNGLVIPDWREQLNCLSCGMINRVRAALHILEQEYSPSEGSSIYLTEYSTNNYRYLASKYENVVGSEYLSSKDISGEAINGIRHEDVQALSFPDHSFDYILCFDVLQHVPDAQRALSEFCRCLVPGGMLLLTVPFSYTNYDDIVCAVPKQAGTNVHQLEPEYDGNFVNLEAGSFWLRYFGWSVLDRLIRTGFDDVAVLSYWSKPLMFLGDPQMVIAAKRSEGNG